MKPVLNTESDCLIGGFVCSTVRSGYGRSLLYCFQHNVTGQVFHSQLGQCQLLMGDTVFRETNWFRPVEDLDSIFCLVTEECGCSNTFGSSGRLSLVVHALPGI